MKKRTLLLLSFLISGCNIVTPTEPKDIKDKLIADLANGITIQNVFVIKVNDTLTILNIDKRPIYVYFEPLDCHYECVPTIWRSINEPHYMMWPYTGPREMSIKVDGPQIYGFEE